MRPFEFGGENCIIGKVTGQAAESDIRSWSNSSESCHCDGSWDIRLFVEEDSGEANMKSGVLDWGSSWSARDADAASDRLINAEFPWVWFPFPCPSVLTIPSCEFNSEAATKSAWCAFSRAWSLVWRAKESWRPKDLPQMAQENGLLPTSAVSQLHGRIMRKIGNETYDFSHVSEYTNVSIGTLQSTRLPQGKNWPVNVQVWKRLSRRKSTWCCYLDGWPRRKGRPDPARSDGHWEASV